jgi:hypothetical protein
MKDLVSRFAIVTASAGLITLPLPANETPVPGKLPPPTLEDVLALQARLEDLKSSDLPDDRKIAEILKLKNAIEIIWPQLRDIDPGKPLLEPPADEEAAGPAPDPHDPSDRYFQGWLLSRDAGKLAEEGKSAEALVKLDRARQLFDRVARDFPDWKPEMVAGRRKQTAESLALFSKQVLALERK